MHEEEEKGLRKKNKKGNQTSQLRRGKKGRGN
jgi:hypothetical protein